MTRSGSDRTGTDPPAATDGHGLASIGTERTGPARHIPARPCPVLRRAQAAFPGPGWGTQGRPRTHRPWRGSVTFCHTRDVPSCPLRASPGAPGGMREGWDAGSACSALSRHGTTCARRDSWKREQPFSLSLNLTEKINRCKNASVCAKKKCVGFAVCWKAILKKQCFPGCSGHGEPGLGQAESGRVSCP